MRKWEWGMRVGRSVAVGYPRSPFSLPHLSGRRLHAAFEVSEIRLHEKVDRGYQVGHYQRPIHFRSRDLDLVVRIQQARILLGAVERAHGEVERGEAEQPNAVLRAGQLDAVIQSVAEMATRLRDQEIHHLMRFIPVSRFLNLLRIEAHELRQLSR